MKRLKDIWDKLPDLEHTKKYVDKFGVRMYEVCDKKFQETTSIDMVIDCLEKYYKQYGQRAKDAQENKNIDHKAVSHAIRAACQLKELYLTGKITFPLLSSDWIKEIKAGKWDYVTRVAPLLENLIQEVKQLAQKSGYPEKVNRKNWDDFLIDVIEKDVLSNLKWVNYCFEQS